MWYARCDDALLPVAGVLRRMGAGCARCAPVVGVPELHVLVLGTLSRAAVFACCCRDMPAFVSHGSRTSIEWCQPPSPVLHK